MGLCISLPAAAAHNQAFIACRMPEADRTWQKRERILSITQKLEKLRVIELSFIRQGKPEPAIAKVAIEKLDRLYPSDNEYLNRELSQLLIYLEAPDVLAKTLTLLDKAKTQEEQVHYI